MGYTDLVFDLYGTLVDIHTEENMAVWEKTAIFFGFYGAHYTADSLKSSFQEELHRREAHEGQAYECYPDIPCEQIMADLFRSRGITRDADNLGIQAAQLFRISSLEYIRVYPHVRNSLQKLRNAGSRLWLLSNAQRIFTAYELRLLELDTCFDGIYISSDYRCRKPDSRFFQALLREQGLHPAQCLMIGNDRDTDIAGARAVGMDTLYMHTALTPADQSPADLTRSLSSKKQHHYEFEGDDWAELTRLLLPVIE